MTSFFFSPSLETSVSLGCFWFENTKLSIVYSREHSLTKVCWGFVEFVTDWISSWVFHMGNQSAQGDFFPFWSMNSIYDMMQYSAEPCGDIIFIVALLQRAGSEVRFNRMPVAGRGLVFAQGRFREVAIHWHECFHPASHMLKDIRSVYLVAQGLELLCLTSSAEPTRACYSVYRQCSF